MRPITGLILSLGYILGVSLATVPWAQYGLLGAGLVAAIALPRLWRTGPRSPVWLLVGIIGCVATFYFHARVPQPGTNDISLFVPASEAQAREQIVTVQGTIASTPRLTRSQRVQFELRAERLNEVTSDDGTAKVSQPVTGKVYATVPLLQGTGLHPGADVAVTGSLYEPKAPANPGAFDFRAYLARQGMFAGLNGDRVTWQQDDREEQWGWWQLRQRIIRSHVRWLRSPEGPLVSAMVLGRRAVDLPDDIRDRFIQVGLAHVLAASGFHVSLILALVLTLTRRWSERIQFGLGTITLILYAGLAGFQPSVLRAAIMGFGALVALMAQRQVRPLGILFLAATILLLVNPLWIEDLGFQLSFLATLGLIVTVMPLVKRLDWLPVTIASLIAVPIAATIWTLPLQLYTFGVVSPYSILANLSSIPFVSIITIGGFISAIAGLIWSPAGSGIAWLLYYPTHSLIAIARFFNQLPGNSIAVGTLSTVQLGTLYGLIGAGVVLAWIHTRRQTLKGKKRPKPLSFSVYLFLLVLAIGVALAPAWRAKADLFRVTVLATPNEPVMVVQDRWRVTLINSGDADTARFTILPFLQREGVNQVEAALAANWSMSPSQGWLQILEQLPVETLYGSAANGNSSDRLLETLRDRDGSYQLLAPGQPQSIGAATVRLIQTNPLLMQLEIEDREWLLLGDLDPSQQNQLTQSKRLPATAILWWSGSYLSEAVLDAIQPQVAIAYSYSIDGNTADRLREAGVQIYQLTANGALQWTPGHQFETILDTGDRDSPLL